MSDIQVMCKNISEEENIKGTKKKSWHTLFFNGLIQCNYEFS